MKAPAEYIVWIDCEMTGLDIDNDGLTEIAVLLTDFDLNVLDSGIDVVIHPGQTALDHMSDFVRKMHAESGLLPLIEHGVSVADAEQQVLDYLNSHFPESAGRPLVAGNTIGMDRRFISKYMEKLDQRLHYRSIDVSTLKELSRRWHPQVFWNAPAKNGGHRALADIAESIQELAYFREAVVVAQPGPSEAEAQRIRTEVSQRFEALLTATNGNDSDTK